MNLAGKVNYHIIPAFFLYLFLGISQSVRGAVDIIFDYSYDTSGFFTSEAKYVMDQAAFAFESRLANQTLGSMIPADYNSTAVGKLVIENPTTGADLNVTFGSTTSRGNIVGKENEIIIFPGARAVGTSYVGKYTSEYNFGDTDLSDSYWTYIDSRDELGDDPPVFGGSLSMNSDLDWYFDTNLTSHSDALNSGKYDFYSAVIHQLGHFFGFDSWMYATDYLWDENYTVFESSNVTNEYSGNGVPVVSESGTNGLNFGDLNTSLINCDCHPAMVEFNSTNTRIPFSDLDFAVLKDVGFTISNAPISNIGGTYTDPTLGGTYYLPVKESYSSWLSSNPTAAPEPHYVFPIMGGVIAILASRKKRPISKILTWLNKSCFFKS